MAARDRMAEFWVRLSSESDRRGFLNFGTPDNASALGTSAGLGASWVIHHRAKHIRAGVFTRDIQSRDPDEVIFKVKDKQSAIEEQTGKKLVIDLPRDGSRSGRAYVRITSFDAEDDSTWDETIQEALDAMRVFVEVMGKKI